MAQYDDRDREIMLLWGVIGAMRHAPIEPCGLAYAQGHIRKDCPRCALIDAKHAVYEAGFSPPNGVVPYPGDPRLENVKKASQQ